MNSHIHTLLALALLHLPCSAADSESAAAVNSPVKDNPEVAQLYSEDQSDRKPKEGKPIDWQLVSQRDKTRRKRVMELYAADELKTGRDYFHAGMVLQHGQRPEDYLLCHELCVAAVFKVGGSERPSWLSDAKRIAAASENRFLLSIGRAQRFGTQFSNAGTNSPWRLDKFEEGVTDELRKAWDVPPLAAARARVAEMNKNNN